jgi:pimeloyl-ACP methyl ester carboxylesterase
VAGLAAWSLMAGVSPPAPTSRHIDANGVRLHCLDWGDASQPALMLLHGGSAHAHWWDLVVPHLADGYRCLALDLRGHGESDWSPARDYRLDTHAADLAVVADALGAERFFLAGHSFGGFVALTFAGGVGARLRGLVIVDSRLRIGERSVRYMEALRKLPHPVYASEAEAIRRFRLLPSGSVAPPDVIGDMVRHGVRRRDDGTWTLKFDRHAMASVPAQDLGPALSATTCPVLAIRAEHSTIVSRDALEQYRTVAPRAELAEIADAHHHVMLDQPAVLARRMREFLDHA